MTIIITGGAGYIGSHTLRKLLLKNIKPIIIDDLSEGHEKALTGGDFVRGNIGDYDLLKTVFTKNRIDVVIHFAANCYVGESVLNPQKYFFNNVINSLNLLRAMLDCNVKKIIFSSSAAVYGEPQYVPIDENHPEGPVNPYGMTKYNFEKILEYYDQAYNLKYVSLRYFNASGADESGIIGEDHEPETHLIPLILKVAQNKRDSITIFGDDYDTSDGTCVRDYIHVSDLAEAHILAVDYLLSENRSTIFNLGNGEGYSVKEIIDISREITGHPIPSVTGKRRAGDPAKLIASSVKISEELGWKPAIPEIGEIIKSAWNWHKNNPNGYI